MQCCTTSPRSAFSSLLPCTSLTPVHRYHAGCPSPAIDWATLPLRFGASECLAWRRLLSCRRMTHLESSICTTGVWCVCHLLVRVCHILQFALTFALVHSVKIHLRAFVIHLNCMPNVAPFLACLCNLCTRQRIHERRLWLDQIQYRALRLALRSICYLSSSSFKASALHHLVPPVSPDMLPYA